MTKSSRQLVDATEGTDERTKRACRQLGVSVVVLAVSLGATIGVSFGVYERRAVNPVALNDIILDVAPSSLSGGTLWPDLMAWLSVAGAFLAAVISDSPVLRCLRLSLYADSLGAMFLLRCFSMFWTSYPDPSPACSGEDPASASSNWAWFIVQHSCGCLMFSAHTSVIITSSIVMMKRVSAKGYRLLIVHIICAAFSTTGALGVLFARMHYTADVAVAVIVSILICQTTLKHWPSSDSLPYDPMTPVSLS